MSEMNKVCLRSGWFQVILVAAPTTSVGPLAGWENRLREQKGYSQAPTASVCRAGVQPQFMKLC